MTDRVIEAIDEALAWEADWERHAMRWTPDRDVADEYLPSPWVPGRTTVWFIPRIENPSTPRLSELEAAGLGPFFMYHVPPPLDAGSILGGIVS